MKPIETIVRKILSIVVETRAAAEVGILHYFVFRHSLPILSPLLIFPDPLFFFFFFFFLQIIGRHSLGVAAMACSLVSEAHTQLILA